MKLYDQLLSAATIVALFEKVDAFRRPERIATLAGCL